MSLQGTQNVILRSDGSDLGKSLARLAVPSIISGWLKTAFLVVDTYFAGLISTDALGALSAATFFVWMFFSLSLLPTTRLVPIKRMKLANLC